MNESDKSKNHVGETIPKKYYKALKDSWGDRDYLSITSILTDIGEKISGEKKKLLFDYILENDRDFYFNIFTEWKILDGFKIKKIYPYLDIKELLSQAKKRIKRFDGLKQKRYLKSYRKLYEYLLKVNIWIKYEDPMDRINKQEILSTLPEHFASIDEQKIKNRISDNLELDLPENIDTSKFKLGKNYIKKSRNFLKSCNEIPPIDLENMLLDEPIPDRYDLWDIQYDNHLSRAKNMQSKEEIIDNYCKKIDDSLRKFDFDTADYLIEKLKKDFPEEEKVIKKYLHVKLKIDELDKVKKYIENNYSENHIENNPLLLQYLSEYEKKEGNIQKSIEFSKKAYETSNKKFDSLVQYTTTLLIHDLEKSEDLIKEHIEKKYDSPTKDRLCDLANWFMYKDKDFAKWLLDHYESLFIEEGDLTGHIKYTSLLNRYFYENWDFYNAKKVLERFIEDNPEEELGYRKLSQFYSNKTNEKIFDMEKSLEYAKKCAQIRGIPAEYYTGISYLNAEKWQDAIEEFESFLEKIPNPHPVYSRIYMHMYNAYMELGQKRKACEFARKYISIYQEARNYEMYNRGAFDIEGTLIEDLYFFHRIKEECSRHKKEAKRIINSKKLWSNNIKKGMENLKLKRKLDELTRKNKKIKEKYEETEDLDDEEAFDNFLSELENNEEARSKILRRINKQNWIESKEKCEKTYKNFEDLPEEIQTFVKTAEFYMLSDNLELDFSGVLLFYTKSVEKILDDKISQEFVEEIGKISNIKDVKEKFIRPLFYQNYRSISLGKWGLLLRQIIENDTHGNDNISQQFYKHVENILEENIGAVQEYASKFAEIRNSKVHTGETTKSEIKEDIGTLRDGVDKIFDIFY